MQNFESIYPLIERNQRLLTSLFWIFMLAAHAWINAETTLFDYARRGEPVETWKPYLWEFSSLIGVLLLLPLIVYWDQYFRLRFGHMKRNLILHLLLSLLFSLLHVLIMVALRHAGYNFANDSYDFGYWPSEFIYEYRKDLLTYIGILMTLYSYRFIISRLKGEATPIETLQNNSSKDAGSDKSHQHVHRFLIKKFGKEFIIRIEDVEWIEAAGNYMNLNINRRTFPLRETMAGLAKKLPPQKFIRVHRSYIVNINHIANISPTDAGDSIIELSNGQKIKMSRRYREQLKSLI